jgi:hypothetical protein
MNQARFLQLSREKILLYLKVLASSINKTTEIYVKIKRHNSATYAQKRFLLDLISPAGSLKIKMSSESDIIVVNSTTIKPSDMPAKAGIIYLSSLKFSRNLV